MSRINCHSSFRHYEMFHSGCHGGNNYGSINNTTYNIDCNGHGSFWGGFGFGLGNAFGGWVNNWFGGGMNFGNFGMCGFPSFGNFSFGGFPGLSGLWGNRDTERTRVSDSDNDGKCHCSEHTAAVCNDPDRTKLANYVGEITELKKKENLTPAELKDLYNRILADKKLSEEEPNHRTTDLKEYNALLEGLKNYGKERGWGDITTDDFGKADGTGDVNDDGNVDETDDGTGNVNDDGNVDETDDGTGNVNDDGNVDGAEGNKPNNGKIDTATTLGNLPAYESLSEADKKKFVDKFIELAHNNEITPEELRTELAKLPADVRIKIKQSFYKNGYTNVSPNELTQETLKNLIEIIDDSIIDDFTDITVGTPTKSGSGTWSIPITSNKSGQKVTYVQVSVDPVDGEIIFHGKNNNQRYVLQKDKDAKLHLMQYKYHDGYGTADVRG